MSSSSRTGLKIAAAVAGIVATALAIVGFNVWLKTQGNDEAAVTAAVVLAISEAQIAQAAAVLEGLAADGATGCGAAQREAMRRAALRAGAVKQVLLLGPDGQAVCADSGAAPDKLQPLGVPPVSGSGVLLDVVKPAGLDERLLRVRSARQPTLAALLAPDVLLPQATLQGERWSGFARVALSNGTTVGEKGAAPKAGEDSQRVSTLLSHRYPLAVTVAAPRRGVIATRDDLGRIAVVMSGALALIILVFAVLISRRETASPIDDIAQAIERDEFVPYYQPLVDLQNGRLLGAEVLVRWRRADGSFVEPNAFVLALESSGLVVEMTRRLMRRVAKEVGAAVGCRPGLALAFNVAPKHFDDALILHDVGTLFEGSTIRMNQIVLELTERHEVVDLTDMRRTVAALQRLGCRVAIDDVGTGHSGLSYILKLGVDIIKMDKIFVEAIGTEGHSKAIIDTLIDLAKNLRMEIVAEGVETFHQVTYLRERGITAAQGYVFAPPLPAATFLQLLEAMDPVGAARGEPQPGKAAAAAG